MKRIVLPLLLLIGLGGGYYYYNTNKAIVPETLSDEFLKIPTGSTMEALEILLESGGYVMDINAFKSRADAEKFVTVRSGRYKIKPGWSSKELVRHLAKGGQEPVKVVLNNEKTPQQVAAKIAKVFEFDSLKFITAFGDQALLDSLGFKKETLMCYFLPNTYEMYWNTDPRKFLERMSKEFKRFWNESRTAKAKALNMTPEQAVTMASIVDGESNHPEEKAKVAGAYLNRYTRGIKLDADPTVQYALMQIEGTSSFRRLMNSDYLVSHPYNTYRNIGLPPGPVNMPSPSSIEAVLNPEKHNFLYFVAKPDANGYHNYAETFEQHLVNVKIYQNSLKAPK